MTTETVKIQVKDVACARCGAEPGEPCSRAVRRPGQRFVEPIKSYHSARRELRRRTHKKARVLNQLRAAYLEAVDRLVERCPVQKRNLKHYRAIAERAALGKMTRDARSKGSISVYKRGEAVLIWLDELDRPVRTVWNREDGDPLRTIVSLHAVRVDWGELR